MSSVTANSRMIYAFSRDGADPRSAAFWHRINHRTRTPTNSIWLAAVGAFILGLPYLYSAVAYAAVTSIAVIGLYVAYVAPVFLRLRAGDKFQAGPWTLGRWSKPIGILATLWVVFIFILFMLPQFQPININSDRHSTTRRSSSPSSSAARRSGTSPRRGSGSRAPRSRARPKSSQPSRRSSRSSDLHPLQRPTSPAGPPAGLVVSQGREGREGREGRGGRGRAEGRGRGDGAGREGRGDGGTGPSREGRGAGREGRGDGGTGPSREGRGAGRERGAGPAARGAGPAARAARAARAAGTGPSRTPGGAREPPSPTYRPRRW